MVYTWATMVLMLTEGWLRPRTTCRHLRLAILLRLHVFIALSVLLSTVRCVQDGAIIALMLPQAGNTAVVVNAGATADAPRGYFPLANALQSAVRLAVDDVNELGSLMEGSLSLVILEVDTAVGAVEGLCNALQAVGDNGTYGIFVPPVSSQASALEVVSNEFFALPMMTPSGSAARAMSYNSGGVDATSEGSSFLFGIQPDIFEQMNALVRLILDMKTERDTKRGWYFGTERVFVLYTFDEYGSVAAAAFSQAAREAVGTNVGYNAAGHENSMIEVISLMSVSANAEEDFQEACAEILKKHASVVVLLAEGFDGRLVRKILTQARNVGMVNEHVQWYLNGVSVMDSVFAVNDTYHDSQLAFDLRGLMGVRACPPTKGPGTRNAAHLTKKWGLLDSKRYSGAGVGTLTPDGRIDPLIAFTYDSVFAMALAISSAQESTDSGGLKGFVGESCPFRTDDMWQPGYVIRSEALDMKFTGATGIVRFENNGSSVTNAAGKAGAGWRKPSGTTFCAFNLQAHASLGGTFVAIKEWRPHFENNLTATNGFEDISDFQKKQTYPSGGSMYPFDRPTLRDRHLTVVTEEAATPFAVVTGLEKKPSDYKGITMDMLNILSVKLGFTYNVTTVNRSVVPSAVVEYVADGAFDMAASWTTITASRLEKAMFSFPFYTTGLSFVYRPEAITEVSYRKILQPFDIYLWGAIFVSTMIVTLLLWLYDGEKELSRSAYVVGALLLGLMSHEPETLESYLLTFGWTIACFILAASFTAEVTSFLLANNAESLFFGFDDLIDGGVSHNQVSLKQGTSYKEFYETQIMSDSVAECGEGCPTNAPIPCYSHEECFELVQNGTVKATLVDTVVAEYMVSNDFCNLDVVPGAFNSEHYGLVLPKDTPYLLELQKTHDSRFLQSIGFIRNKFLGEFELIFFATFKAIGVLREDGTLDMISASYLDSSKCAYVEAHNAGSADSQNLSLADMWGVFVVLEIFVAASFVTWIFRRSAPAKKMRRWYFARRKAITSSKTTVALGSGDLERRRKTRVPQPPLPNIMEHNVASDNDTSQSKWPVVPLPTRYWYRPPYRLAGEESEQTATE